ncbi:MAG: ubiquinone/menaquinone biosynthesis methyltransferase [Candidatus Methanomethylophilaceae archaeon]
MTEEDKVGNQFEGKEGYVKDVFEDIAPYYDKMNGIMSMGMVKGWHKFMFKKAGNISGFRILDVGCGTGEISFMASRAAGVDGKVTGIDITPGMLEMAKVKMKDMDLPNDIDFQVGDALMLPYDDDSFDLVTSGYMLRNVTDIQRAVNEMFRVLKPGHRAIVAELAKPKNRFLLWGYNIYVFKVVPWWGRRYDKGKVIDGKQPAYDWLTSSLEGFPHGEDMVEKFRNAGFSDTRYYSRSFGAVNIYIGTKPSE